MAEWDGTERRSDELSGVKAELSTVREALILVSRGMESFVSTEEIDRRIAYEERQRRKMSGVLGLGILVAIMSIGLNIAQVQDLHHRAIINRESNKTAQKVTVDAVNCILHSLHQHRDANEYAHQLIASSLAHPAPYREPADLVPGPEEDAVKTSCTELSRLLQAGVPQKVTK